MLKQKNNDSETINLPDIDNYMARGYRIGVITEAKLKGQYSKESLDTKLEISAGKHKGFKLSTSFPLTYKGRRRLSYLCKALGITGKVNPAQLIGRKLKILVVPKKREYMGKTYINYVITRFHPIDRDIRK